MLTGDVNVFLSVLEGWAVRGVRELQGQLPLILEYLNS